MNTVPSSPSWRISRPVVAESADRSRPPRPGQPAWPRARSELASLVEQYADLLVWHAFRLLGSMPDAEDVVQDVFVKVFAAGRGDEVASIRAYLYRAVANACTDLHRSRTRTARRFEPAELDRLENDDAGPPESAQAVEEAARIEALLGRLPAEQAQAIRLRVFDGLRLDEIAEVLDCPTNTVSSRLRYGFQKLREAVGREGADHELP
jgi:RNA polymerase sigma-70 factor (ECF subfamily)